MTSLPNRWNCKTSIRISPQSDERLISDFVAPKTKEGTDDLHFFQASLAAYKTPQGLEVASMDASRGGNLSLLPDSICIFFIFALFLYRRR